MEKSLLDETFDEKINILQIIGIGIFFNLSILNFSYLLTNLVREFLMSRQYDPKLNFWVTELSICLLILIISGLFFKKLQKARKLNQLLVFLIILSICGATLKFLFKNYFFQFLSPNILIEMKKFNDEVLDNGMYKIPFLIFEYLPWIFIALLIFKEKNNFTKT